MRSNVRSEYNNKNESEKDVSSTCDEVSSTAPQLPGQMMESVGSYTILLQIEAVSDDVHVQLTPEMYV